MAKFRSKLRNFSQMMKGSHGIKEIKEIQGQNVT